MEGLVTYPGKHSVAPSTGELSSGTWGGSVDIPFCSGQKSFILPFEDPRKHRRFHEVVAHRRKVREPFVGGMERRAFACAVTNHDINTLHFAGSDPRFALDGSA